MQSSYINSKLFFLSHVDNPDLEQKFAPVCDVVDEMLLKHKTPALYDVEESLFKGFCVHAEPRVEYSNWVNFFNLAVDLLVRVNLHKTKGGNFSVNFMK